MKRFLTRLVCLVVCLLAAGVAAVAQGGGTAPGQVFLTPEAAACRHDGPILQGVPFAQSVSACQNLIARYPGEPHFPWYLAQLYLRHRDCAGGSALPYAQRALQLNKDPYTDPAIRFDLLAAEFCAKRYADTAAQGKPLEQLLLDNASSNGVVDRLDYLPSIQVMLGLSEFQLNSYPAAARHLSLARRFSAAGGFSETEFAELGVAQAVQGDGADAVDTLTGGMRTFPSSKNLHDWWLVASFERDGLRAAPVRDASSRQDRIAAYDLASRGAVDLGNRASTQRMNYAALRHYGTALLALEALYARSSGSNVYGPYDAVQVSLVEQGRDPDIVGLRSKLAALYGRLPLKPMPTAQSVQAALAAQAALDRADVWTARTGYANAAALSPWWPEAHYNLGLLMGLTGQGMYRDAGRLEMARYLALSPQGDHAVSARGYVRAWGGAL
jgi:hypothetical protein